MAQFNINFGRMTGTILNRRPGLDRNVVMDLLNERMRSILDKRPIWSGLRKNIVVSIPNSYITGSITLTTGSTAVTGAATAWPVSDVVNTAIVERIPAAGAVMVTPASMAGITRDTVLYVDAAGPNPEILPVLDILGPRVLLNFQQAHAAGFSATASSLNGLQLRPDGYTTPVFTVIAITSPTSLTIDQPWGQVNQVNSGYQIIKMYSTIDPMLKDIVTASDPFQQIALRLQVPQQELNESDPNRTATNSPTKISPRGPNVNGNMQYEIWPPQTTSYQLNFLIDLQWPDMRLPSDYPFPGINPNVFLYGALADAYVTPCPRGPDMKDPGFSPEASAKYEAMFQRAYEDAINADESVLQQSWTWDTSRTGFASLGADWAVSHDYSSAIGDF